MRVIPCSRAVEDDSKAFAQAKRDSEIASQQLSDSVSQLASVTAELEGVRADHARLARLVSSLTANSGERFFFAIPMTVLLRVASMIGEASMSSLAVSSRSLLAKLSPLQANTQQLQRPRKHRAESDCSVSDSVSIVTTPSTATTTTAVAIPGAGMAARRQQWLVAAAAASGSTSDSASPNLKVNTQPSTGRSDATAGRVTPGGISTSQTSSSGGSGLFRFVGSGKPQLRTPERDIGGSKSPGSAATGSGSEVLPRGKALDYDAASRLLARLTDAGRQLQAQQALILDLQEKLRTADTVRERSGSLRDGQEGHGPNACMLPLQVKEFLSRQMAERDDALRKAVAARDALTAQAGIDREVLSFLDEKSTELEHTTLRLSKERDQAVALASEAQQMQDQLQMQLAAIQSEGAAAALQRDDLRIALDAARGRIMDLEARCAVALDAAAAAETRSQQYESMLETTDDSGQRDAAASSAVAAAAVAALQHRVSVLESQLDAAVSKQTELVSQLSAAGAKREELEIQIEEAGTKRGELEATLRLLELEAKAAAADKKAAQSREAALESQRGLDVSVVPSVAPSIAQPTSGVAAGPTVEDLVAERERLETRWKAERKALAMEVRKLRAELLCAQGGANGTSQVAVAALTESSGER